MQIAGLQKTTFIDYPGLIAATVFTRGCSFRCPFCHNPELVLPKEFNPLLDEDEIMDFFKKRAGQLQGVCITGGEPTLQADLPDFIAELKSLGYKVKLDTNGWNPTTLEHIIQSGTVDYLAMDIKTTLEKYSSVVIPNSKFLISNQISNIKSNICHSERSEESLPTPNSQLPTIIKSSIDLIMSSGIDYEFRTTVCHPIHELEDFREIGKMIQGAKRYFIQNFVHSKHIDEHQKFEPFTEEEMVEIEKKMSEFVNSTRIR